MPSLKEALDTLRDQVTENAPLQVLTTMMQSTADLKDSGIEERAFKAGDVMPDFTLPNQHGEMRRFYDYLQHSPVVLNIYRGGWCPYCNLEMKALHDALPAIRAAGAVLVGMSPEIPDQALVTAQGAGIDIDILSDAGNVVSDWLGLVFELPEALRPIYAQFGIDIPAHNGDNSFRLPLPATYLVGRDGVVAHAHVDADYTHRLEPEDILAWLDAMNEG